MTRILLKIVLVCKFVALVTSAAIRDESLSEIIESKNNIDGKGNYVFSFRTTTGLIRYEEGKVVNVGEPDEHIEVTGYYSYINDAGIRVLINYTAGKNGFQPKFEESSIMPVLCAPQECINLTKIDETAPYFDIDTSSDQISGVPPAILASLAG